MSNSDPQTHKEKVGERERENHTHTYRDTCTHRQVLFSCENSWQVSEAAAKKLPPSP